MLFNCKPIVNQDMRGLYKSAIVYLGVTEK